MPPLTFFLTHSTAVKLARPDLQCYALPGRALRWLGARGSGRRAGLVWAVLGCSGLLWAALGCSGMLGAALDCSALGCSGLFWAALGCSGLLWAALGHSGLLWASLGCSRAALGCSGVRQEGQGNRDGAICIVIYNTLLPPIADYIVFYNGLSCRGAVCIVNYSTHLRKRAFRLGRPAKVPPLADSADPGGPPPRPCGGKAIQDYF